MSVPRKHLIDTIADLTSAAANPKANLKDGQQITVAGYYAAGDKEAVTYVWNAVSTATANGGTVLAHDDGGDGRFLLEKDVVSVKDFGAVGDGTGDVGAVINVMLSAGVRTIFFPPGGTYKQTSEIVVTQDDVGILLPKGAVLDATGLVTGGTSGIATSTNVIASFKVSGARFLITAGGRAVSARIVTGNQTAFVLSSSEEAVIDGINIDSYYAGFYGYNNCIRPQIVGCVIENCTYNIRCGKDIANILLSSDVQVTGLYASKNVLRNAVTDCIKTIANTNEIRIVDNSIYGAAQDGIDMFLSGEDAIIANNQIYGNSIKGIDLKLGATVADGIYGFARRIQITGNIINNNIFEGIQLATTISQGLWASGATYTATTHRHNSAGRVYYLKSAGGGTTANEPVHTTGTVTGADGYEWVFVADRRENPYIIVANNIIKENGKSGLRGEIFGFVISSNIVADNGEYGMRLDGSSYGSIDRNIFSKNCVVNRTSGLILAASPNTSRKNSFLSVNSNFFEGGAGQSTGLVALDSGVENSEIIFNKGLLHTTREFDFSTSYTNMKIYSNSGVHNNQQNIVPHGITGAHISDVAGTPSGTDAAIIADLQTTVEMIIDVLEEFKMDPGA